MENNDSPMKLQPTGGLKLMTVFIAVLALHVVVIGGMTVYYMLKGGSADADLVADKTHKSVKVTPDGATVSEGQLTDGVQPDKAVTAAAPADTNGAPITIPAPTTDATADATASTDATAAAPIQAAPVQAAPTPAPEAPAAPAPATDTAAAAPSGPVRNGPVITPPQSTPAPQAPATSLAESPAAETPATEPETPAAAPAPKPVAKTYTVKISDSLARIAKHHHITVAQLKSANGMKGDTLHVGQKLTIPGHSLAATPTSLAALREPNAALLGDSNIDTTAKPAKAKAVTASLHQKTASTASIGGHHTYTVMKGDTLTKIARKFHTTRSAILAANGTVDSHKLKIGQKLRIPSQESRSANTSPVAQPVNPPTPDQTETKSAPTAQLANYLPY